MVICHLSMFLEVISKKDEMFLGFLGDNAVLPLLAECIAQIIMFLSGGFPPFLHSHTLISLVRKAAIFFSGVFFYHLNDLDYLSGNASFASFLTPAHTLKTPHCYRSPGLLGVGKRQN